ncbi:MAG: WD40 repeat domain-containing protein [Saprospiraceae bacterium]|nr:WD40 repeat domain-containing protein [Saprospiraceae bacterium]
MIFVRDMKMHLQRKLVGHKGSVYSIVFDSGSQQIYSGGGDGWLVSWNRDEADGKLIADVGDQIFCLSVIEGQRVVAGSMSGELYFIGLSSAAGPRKKVFHQKGIYDLLSIGRYLISAGGDGKLGFWNLETTEIEESIVLSHHRIRCLALSPDKSVLAVGDSHGDIRFLSTDDWRLLHRISAHDPSVFSLAWLDNERIVSGGRDAHLKVWDYHSTDEPQFDLAAHWYTVNHMQSHPSDTLLATASRDKTIRLWETMNFSVVQTLDAARSGGHINSVNRLVWTDDGKQLFAGSDDNSISVWEFS